MTNDYGNLELHKVLLSAMKDIDKICRENGLKYYLHAGTLLGAINHKGFIPWDDDVDIVFTIEDYAIFKSVVEREYSYKYYLETFENTDLHFSKLNKLRINGSSILYEDGTEEEIFVDVAVFHNAPNSKWLRTLQRFCLELFDKVLAVKAGAIVPTSWKSRLFLRPLSYLSKHLLGVCLDNIMGWFDNKVTDYYALMIHMLPNPYTGMNGYENDFVPRYLCDNPRYVDFEDTAFMVYSEPEIDLVRRYGIEYSKPYPEEKRTSKHGIVSYSVEIGEIL